MGDSKRLDRLEPPGFVSLFPSLELTFLGLNMFVLKENWLFWSLERVKAPLEMV